jgi:hypothetical protein
MDPDANSDPAIFVSELQDSHQEKMFLSFFAYYFLKVHLHHFSKIKNYGTKKSQKGRINVFLTFCLIIEESGSGSVTNESGPVPGGPKTYGSYGSRSGFGSGSATLVRTQEKRKKKADIMEDDGP